MGYGSKEPKVGKGRGLELESARADVKRAAIEEALLVRKIMLAAFEEYREILNPPSSSYKESLEDVERAMLEGGAVLARVQGAPVGSARFKLGPDHLYVGRVAVLPEYRGRGIASNMMKWLEGFAPSVDRDVVRVDVRMALTSNLALFQLLGYELVNTYQHPKGSAMCGMLVKRLPRVEVKQSRQKTPKND